MERKQASEFPREVLDLFDAYVHGGLSRREFVERAARFAVGGLTGAALLSALSPNYAWAEQVEPDDPRIETDRVTYQAPEGNGAVEALLARPAGKEEEKLPAVVVVHENRGLNPYIEDVARRLAVAGYLALAPDGLTSLGGYPGTDDEGRDMQRKLDREKLVQDFLAGARWLKKYEASNGKVGVVGFCFGGMVSNRLAVLMPELAASVPFYGGQPEAGQAAKIKARMLFHFAENDPRVNAGWPAWKAALERHGVTFEAHTYAGTNHGFHNDTTPRYDEAAAKLAWERTLACFAEALKA